MWKGLSTEAHSRKLQLLTNKLIKYLKTVKKDALHIYKKTPFNYTYTHMHDLYL